MIKVFKSNLSPKQKLALASLEVSHESHRESVQDFILHVREECRGHTAGTALVLMRRAMNHHLLSRMAKTKKAGEAELCAVNAICHCLADLHGYTDSFYFSAMQGLLGTDKMSIHEKGVVLNTLLEHPRK